MTVTTGWTRVLRNATCPRNSWCRRSQKSVQTWSIVVVRNGDAPPEPEPGCKGASEYFGSDEQLRAKAAQLKQQIKTEVLRAGQEGKASQWRDQLHRSGKRRTEEIERAARTLSAEDHEWCQSMVAATCRAASQVAAVSSLAVANGALTEAAKKVEPR